MYAKKYKKDKVIVQDSAIPDHVQITKEQKNIKHKWYIVVLRKYRSKR